MLTNIRRSGVFATVGLLSLTALGMGSAHAGVWHKDGTPVFTFTLDPPSSNNGGNYSYNGLNSSNLSTTFTISAGAGAYTGPMSQFMGQSSSANYRVQCYQKYVYTPTGDWTGGGGYNSFMAVIEADYSCDAAATTIGAAQAGSGANTVYLGANGLIDILGGGASAGYDKTSDHKDNSNHNDQQPPFVVSNNVSGNLPYSTQDSAGIWRTSLTTASWASASGNRRVPPPSANASTTYMATSHVGLSVVFPN
jgi:hypothetical protein